MQDKATLMARDTCDHSLSSMQTLQQQRRRLEVRAHALGFLSEPLPEDSG